MSFVFAYLMLYGLPGKRVHDFHDCPLLMHYRILSTNATKGSKLLEDPVPSKIGLVVRGTLQ
jgi:hypothetical protein